MFHTWGCLYNPVHSDTPIHLDAQTFRHPPIPPYVQTPPYVPNAPLCICMS